MHRVDGCYAAIWLWACSGDALAMLFRSGSCRGLLLAVVAAIARCCPWLICIVRPIGRLNPWCPPQPPLVPPPLASMRRNEKPKTPHTVDPFEGVEQRRGVVGDATGTPLMASGGINRRGGR